MSTSEATSRPSVLGSRAPYAEPGRANVARHLRLARSELTLVFRRRRNLALLAVLAAVPMLIGTAVKVSAPSGDDGPQFLNQVTQNGLFLVFTALTVTMVLVLPLAVSVVTGESVAGEASTGTLRSLLVVPVGRTRLLAVKYLGIVAFALTAVLTVSLVGLVVGLVLFPHGDVTLLSGSTTSYLGAIGRAVLVALYVTAMLAGLGAIGLFVSTLTEVPMGATAATAVLTVGSEILDSIPQVHAIHPYLFTHRWLDFGDLLRDPMAFHGVQTGLLTQALYAVIFLSLAWARLTT